MTPERFGEIQRAVVDEGVDAWLFYDFRGSDPIGCRVLPGEFGIRSEIDVYIDGREAVVTGQPIQTAIVPILGERQ